MSRGCNGMGLKPNPELVESIGIHLDGIGYVAVDEHHCITIRGIYVVGDVVSNQIRQLSVGMGHLAKASVAIHNSLMIW